MLKAADGSLTSALSKSFTIAAAAAKKLVFTQQPGTASHTAVFGTIKVAIEDIFGNIVTSWSFMGTNMLGIGLHAYGFMDQAVPWLVGFWLFNLALIACGMIPLRHWRSYQLDTAPAFELAGAR